MESLQKRDNTSAESGQQEGSIHLHWGWNLLLANAAGFVLCALVIDPDSAQSELEHGQLTILRGLLVAGAAAHVGVWTLRHKLAPDFTAAFARWSRVPADLSLASFLPEVGGPALARTLWGIVIGWAVVVVVGLLVAAPALNDMTYENGPTETLTVLAYLAGAGFAVASFRLCSLTGRAPGVRRWILLLAAVGCFLIAGEETDWGQVYLDYATPEAFEKANIQSDLSLHNLAPPGVVPGTRWANWMLRGLALFLGGVVPLLISRSAWFRKWMWSWDIPVPPLICLVMLFASVWIPEAADLYERDNVGSELREVTISVAVALWMFSAWRRDKAS